jgi:putative ABC transport system permease protein
VVFGEILHYLGTVVLGAATSIVVPFTLSPLTPVYIVTALVTCLAGAYPPARRAAQLNIIDAISAE